MSTWINRLCLIASLTAGLTACKTLDLAPTGQSMTILGGSMTVAPPDGYCINAAASKIEDDSAVMLMGRCLIGTNRPPALLTTSIGASGSDTALTHGPIALTSFFGSAAGLAMLASSGKAEDARLDASQSTNDALYLLINDRLEGPYWRAFSALHGRLLTLTAVGVDDIALDPDDGRNLLTQALMALQDANVTAPAATAE